MTAVQTCGMEQQTLGASLSPNALGKRVVSSGAWYE